jgi:1-acyl-sn-glycerol-3-phosphate acyltransferase
VTSAPSAELELLPRLHLAVQREITRLLPPVAFTLLWLAPRIGLGYRIERLASVRREYREIRARSDAPLLVCANHLTMIDSFLITWAIESPLWFFLHFSSAQWNGPDRRNFAATPWQKALIYALECIPIQRREDPR